MTQQDEPLLPTATGQQQQQQPHALLPPLPPSYTQDGALKYYAVWAWRFFIFSLSGSLSLRVCLWCLAWAKLSTVWLFLWATVLEVVGVYPLTVLLLGTLLGQRRFYGRLVYRGWGRWMLPLRAQQAWLASGWI